MADSFFDFTTPTFGFPANRKLIWDTIPPLDQDEDLQSEGQMRRMAVVLQDLANVLWCRTDSLRNLYDPNTMPSVFVDYLLYTLGNPFQFPLTELEKRRLAESLVAIYKKIGTKQVIEDAIAFFTGIPMVVRQFLLGDSWTLGVDTLGLTTVVGPGSKLAKNLYEIISPLQLTEEQLRQVREIAEFLDPVYMRLFRIIEPGDTPGTLIYWVLGQSGLGYSTQLAP